MANETTLRAWLAKIFRLAADGLAPTAAERPTIDAIKTELAYEVEVALLRAEEDEERATHTVLMLRQRLRRLNGESHPPAVVPACAGSGSTQVVRRGTGHDHGVPVPAGRATVAEPEAAVREAAGRAFGSVRLESHVPAAVVRGLAGGDQR